MASISSAEKRGRGRPRTNPVAQHFTMAQQLSASIDAWIARQPDPKPTRPEAIRRLIEIGLTAGEPVQDRTDQSALSPGRLRSLQNLKSWRPGQSGNPAGSTRGKREAGREAREARRLAREGSARAVRRLVELVDSGDEQVAAMAAQAVLKRAGRAPTE